MWRLLLKVNQKLFIALPVMRLSIFAPILIIYALNFILSTWIGRRRRRPFRSMRSTGGDPGPDTAAAFGKSGFAHRGAQSAPWETAPVTLTAKPVSSA